MRNELSKNLETFKQKIGTQDIDNKEYQLILENLLVERELLLEEKDYILYSRNNNYNYNDPGLTILINELNEDVFNSLAVCSKKLDLGLPSLFNILMEMVNEEIDTDFPNLSSQMLKQKLQRFDQIKINHLKTVNVNDDDLIELGDDETMVSFNHIGILDLSQVTLQSFLKYVSSINHCKHVIVPDSWSKLLVYFKSNWCKFYEFV